MTHPLITVGIPAYNHAPFIRHAIESVINQNIRNIEIIIVDDASTDDTAEIAKKYSLVDDRILFIQNEKNLGPAKTTEIILSYARGEYFSPLPSDDYVALDKYEKLLEVIEKDPRMAFVFSDANFVDENGKEIKNKNHFASGHFDLSKRNRLQWLRYFFNAGNCVCASGHLIRTDVLRKYKPDHRLMLLHDYDLWVRMVIDGFNIGSVNEKLTYYRVLNRHKNMSAPSSAVKKQRIFEHIKVLERFTKLTRLDELNSIAKTSFDRVPNGVSEDVFVQHQLTFYAWSLKRPQFRLFALDNWYRMMGDDSIEDQLNILTVNSKFLADKTKQNPLLSIGFLIKHCFFYKALDVLIPGWARFFLIKKIKKLRGD